MQFVFSKLYFGGIYGGDGAGDAWSYSVALDGKPWYTSYIYPVNVAVQNGWYPEEEDDFWRSLIEAGTTWGVESMDIEGDPDSPEEITYDDHSYLWLTEEEAVKAAEMTAPKELRDHITWVKELYPEAEVVEENNVS